MRDSPGRLSPAGVGDVESAPGQLERLDFDLWDLSNWNREAWDWDERGRVTGPACGREGRRRVAPRLRRHDGRLRPHSAVCKPAPGPFGLGANLDHSRIQANQ